MKFTEWCPELVAELAKPFPRNMHASKGSKGTFVSVHHYVARLNDLVGPQGWSMPAPSSYHAGNKLGLCVGVTILGVTKWNVGDEMEDHGEPDDDNVVRDFGSSSTNSWAQGFKRCCAYGFGLGLYLYDKVFTRTYLSGADRAGAAREREPERSGASDRKGSKALPPPSTPVDTLATAQQLNAIGILFDVHEIEYEEREQLVKEVNSGTMLYSRAADVIRKVQKYPKLPAEKSA
jgi:hypothetical protein